VQDRTPELPDRPERPFQLPEHSYASLALARGLIADVLADLVSRDYSDADLAIEVAEHTLYKNGTDFGRIAETRADCC
jgi:hypothetical protein